MPKPLRTGYLIALTGLLSLPLAHRAAAQKVRVGRNVNMVSGAALPGGDPYLQRQNEPSIAASTRNPLHLLAGANDYRTVDLPGVDGAVETGDAWQGVFFSDDGGESWSSTLLPGFPQDQSPEGLASPLRGYEAASDPVVRAGPHGLFFYSGIAFDRREGGASTVFVARFLDLNNTENANPIRYVDTISVDRRPQGAEPAPSGSESEFIDKPWLAVDVPRLGARWCSFEVPSEPGNPDSQSVSQRFRGGNVYLAYSVISRDDDGELWSRIQFTLSRDCGATWSLPVRLSPPEMRVNQGATIAIDPLKGTVYVAWRQFSLGVEDQVDAIHLVRADRGGWGFDRAETVSKLRVHGAHHDLWRRSFTQKADNRFGVKKPRTAGEIELPFDQPTLPSQVPGLELVRAFRVNSYPTMTVDAESRVYVAWSELGHGDADPASGDPGDARIVVASGKKGRKWLDPPVVVDSPRDPNGGLRKGHQVMPSLTFAAGKLLLAYYDFRDDAVEIEGPVPFIVDPIPDNGLRHSVDIRVAIAEPGQEPRFSDYGNEGDDPTVRVSRYLFSPDAEDPRALRQAQHNFVNLPLFAQGQVPFLGDYLDAASSRVFVQDERGRWKHNVGGGESGVFHIAWADNRDVVPPLDGDWTKYEPPTSLQPAPFPSPVFTGAIEACSERTGMRNQNVYSARVSEGLVVGSPANTKPLGETTLSDGTTVLLQRAFVAFIRNATEEERSYRLSVLDQPPDFNAGDPGSAGQASFLQFEHRTTLDASIPAHSSISRPVFVKSSDETASVRILVQQIDAPEGSLITGGLTGLIRLNPDVLNPEILNPEILNPDQSPVGVQSEEVHNPEILNPEILNPEILNPEILNPEILNPDVVNPEILNPEILNPEILNPEILNPEILNAVQTGVLTDLTWTLRNDGNTTTSYAARPFIRSGAPEGFRFQLLVYRIHSTPAVNLVDCRLETDPLSQRQHHELLVDIRNPEILNPEIFNPEILNPEILNSSPDIASFFIAPGESVRVTLRVLDPDKSDDVVLDEDTVSLATVAQAVNTVEAALGVTDPPVSYQASAPPALGSGSLPSPLMGAFYDQPIAVSGGVAPLTWNVVTGTLPPGLALDSATGRLSGTPSQQGDFVFEISVTDSAIPPRTGTRSFTLTVAASVFAYVANDLSHNVTVIDTATNTVAATIELGFGHNPHSLAVSPDGRFVYTANNSPSPDQGTVSAIDTATNTVSATIPTGGGNYGIGITPDGSTLYVTNFAGSLSNNVWVVDTATNTVTQSIALDSVDRNPRGVAITANGAVVYVTSTLSNEVFVIDTATNLVTATIPVGGNPHEMAISPDGSFAYVSNSDDGTVSVISTTTNSVTATIPLATDLPEGIVFSNDGSLAYVSNHRSNYVYIIDTATSTVIDTIIVGTSPFGLAKLPDGRRLYVANQASGDVSVVDTQTNTVVATVPSAPGSGPVNIALVSLRPAAPVLGSSLPSPLVGAFYNEPIPLSGGVAPFTWSVVSGSLPPGLALDSATGRLSGTPSLFGDFVFEISVTDFVFPPRTSSHIFSVTVGAPITTFAGSFVPDGVAALSVGLAGPGSIAVDSTGNVYIPSPGLGVVRSVDVSTGVLSIVAGNGRRHRGFSGDGGPAHEAQLITPSDTAFDSDDNLFIADVNNARVRRVDRATGVITTVAGTGVAGFSGDGGPATAAQIRQPSGVAVDSMGNLYIADGADTRIRKVDAATGAITTVAGNGTSGYSGDGGPAVAAQLGLDVPSISLLDVSVDQDGNLFIDDYYNHRIRRVDAATGIITTVAGDGTRGFSGDGGPAIAAQVDSPRGTSVDAAGNLWIASSPNVRRVDAATSVITSVAGNGLEGFPGAGDGGPALAAQLVFPQGVSLDVSGNLYILDGGDQRVRRVDGAGIITTIAGNGSFNASGDGGPAQSATLGVPQGLVLDSSGSLLIADSSNNQVRRVDAATSVIQTVAGIGGSVIFGGVGPAPGDGGPATLAQVARPQDVASDASGNIFIAERDRVRRIDEPTGIINTVAGDGSFGFSGDGGPATAAGFGGITGIALSSNDELWIADSQNHRIRRVDAGGIVTTVAGTGVQSSSGDGGPAVLADLNLPWSVAFDEQGNVFASERGGHRIRRIDGSTGIISTVAGTGITGFSGDGGLATAAQLSFPGYIIVDAEGDLFIADLLNNRVRRVDSSTGIIKTVAGGGTSAEDGVASTDTAMVPLGLETDNLGRLFISDVSPYRVRVVLLRN